MATQGNRRPPPRRTKKEGGRSKEEPFSTGAATHPARRRRRRTEPTVLTWEENVANAWCEYYYIHSPEAGGDPVGEILG